MSENWTLTGTFVEACNCDVACNCIYGSPPTSSVCKFFVGWHVDKGSYSDLALDGMNVALAGYALGDMNQNDWKVALYCDVKASEAQKDALIKIFSGQAGGPPAQLAKGFGEVVGAKSVGIDFSAQGKRRSLKIADVGELEIEALSGRDDSSNVTLVNGHFAGTAPGGITTVARSKKLSFHDYGWQWEISEKSGYFCAFAYQGN